MDSPGHARNGMAVAAVVVAAALVSACGGGTAKLGSASGSGTGASTTSNMSLWLVW